MRVGDKFIGFKFEDDTMDINWADRMEDCIGREGTIVEVNPDDICIRFSGSESWWYPITKDGKPYDINRYN